MEGDIQLLDGHKGPKEKSKKGRSRGLLERGPVKAPLTTLRQRKPRGNLWESVSHSRNSQCEGRVPVCTCA